MKTLLSITFMVVIFFALEEVKAQDFLCNREDKSALTIDDPPRVAMNSSGRTVMVWRDARNGDLDIWAQIVDKDGKPVGGNIRVNSDTGSTEQFDPVVGIDGNGNFVVVWRDKGGGVFKAQWFNADGTRKRSADSINDLSIGFPWQLLDAAMSENSRTVVTWTSDYNGDYRVFAQVYDADGKEVGGDILVSTAGEIEWSGVIKHGVGMDASGNFVIAWSDNRLKGIGASFIQRFDANGKAIGANTLVNDTSYKAPSSRANISVNSSGDFVVVWKDQRKGFSSDADIYAQRFNASGNKLGNEILVNDDGKDYHQGDPVVALADDGSFMVAWQDERNDYYDVYAQRYDASGNPQGSNFVVDDDKGEGYQQEADIAFGNGIYTVCWLNDYYQGQDIHFHQFNKQGSAAGNVKVANDDTNAGLQEYMSSAISANGTFMVVWSDYRDDFRGDIYGQRFSTKGHAIGPNILINDDNANVSTQWQTDVSLDPNGNAVVVWVDERQPSSYEIYAQRFDASGMPVDTNFNVDDGTAIGSSMSNPAVAHNKNGDFVIVWSTYSTSKYIYARCYSSDGKPKTGDIQVNDIQKYTHDNPDVAMRNDGSFIVTWSYSNRIYYRTFDANGTPDTISRYAGINPYYRYNIIPSVATCDDGRFVIAWNSETSSTGSTDIYVQQFDANNEKVDTQYLVNKTPQFNYYTYPGVSVAMHPDGDRFIVTWTDYSNPDGDGDVYAQIFENGKPKGNRQQISETDAKPWYHQQTGPHSVAASDSFIICSWQDTRRLKNWDIYGHLMKWNLSGVHVTEEHNIQKLQTLEQVTLYPNPASQKVNLMLKPSHEQTNLVVYDIMGKELYKRLIPGNTKSLEIDVSQWKDGLYFFQFNKGNRSFTQKLIISK